MKQALAILVLFVSALCAFAEGPSISFSMSQYDFGTVTQQSEPVVIEYKFTNTGDKPLVIISANSPCGCTQATYPDAPVAPGAEGAITLRFNPKHQLGEINKAVTVRTNDKKHKKVTLRITGVVVK